MKHFLRFPGESRGRNNLICKLDFEILIVQGPVRPDMLRFQIQHPLMLTTLQITRRKINSM